MSYNYHKRLTGYLSEPKYYARPTPADRYLQAAGKYAPGRPGVAGCRRCEGAQGGRDVEQGKSREQGSKEVLREYFGPELQDIRDVLRDIRERMSGEEAGSVAKSRVSALSITDKTQAKPARHHYHPSNHPSNHLNPQYPQPHPDSPALHLQQQLQQLNQHNSLLQSQLHTCTQQLSANSNQIQSLTTTLADKQQQLQHAQRTQQKLQNTILQLRQKMVKYQQYQLMKQTTMPRWYKFAYTLEYNVVVDWQGGGEGQGWMRANQEQDRLCERINAGVLAEEDLFARLGQIEGKLGELWGWLEELHRQCQLQD